MPLSDWLLNAGDDKGFAAFLEYLDQVAAGTADKSSVNLTGLSDTQKSFVQSLIYSKEQNPFWVLVADELRARLAAQELRAFLGSGVYVFSARDLHLLDARAASREQERRRLAILQKVRNRDYKALVVPAAALLDCLPPPEVLRGRAKA